MYREIAERIAHASVSELRDQLMQSLIDDVVMYKGPAWVAQAIKFYALSSEDDLLMREIVRAGYRAEKRFLETIFDADRASVDYRRLSIAEVIERSAAVECYEDAEMEE